MHFNRGQATETFKFLQASDGKFRIKLVKMRMWLWFACMAFTFRN